MCVIDYHHTQQQQQIQFSEDIKSMLESHNVTTRVTEIQKAAPRLTYNISYSTALLKL